MVRKTLPIVLAVGLLSGCALLEPKWKEGPIEVPVKIFHSGATARLTKKPVQSPEGISDEAEWMPVEDGKAVTVNSGVYGYAIELKDGRKKEGLLALYSDAPVVLK